MNRVIERLREDHINLARLLHVLEEQIDAFRNERVPDYELIGDVLDYMLNYPDLCHHPIEDGVYRRLRQRSPSIAASLDDLERQHAQLADRIRRFAAAVHNVRNDALVPRAWFVAMAEDLLHLWRRHMIVEETSVQPTALTALTPADWTEIENALKSGKDPLFGAKVGRGYRRLYRRIVGAPNPTPTPETVPWLAPAAPPGPRG